MKKILVLLIAIIALSGCSSEEVKKEDVLPGDIGEKSSCNSDNERGIVLDLEKGSLTNTGVGLNIINNSKKTIYFGTPFSVEKEENGQWYYLKFINDDIVWTLPLYNLEPGGAMRVGSDSWSNMYGELPKGKYRLVKYVYFEEDDEFCISYEFTLE